MDLLPDPAMSAPLHVVILAAGEGKRMKSALPKVLQKIAGRPMLAHAIDAARALQPQGIHVVYGHGGEAVRAAFADQPGLAWAEQARVLLVAYDLPLPAPMAGRRKIVAPFGVALLLNPALPVNRLALLRLASGGDEPADRLDDAGLERLRAGNPAARSLPLLCAMAQKAAKRVILSAGDSATLSVEVAP